MTVTRGTSAAAAILVLWSGAALGQIDAGAAQPGPPAAETIDGGSSTVEVHGLQVPIEADPSLPGHRPVEGTIDPDDLPRRPTPPPEDRGIYDDFLESRTSDLDNCAIWSPGGAAVKGWFVAEWTVEASGQPQQLRVIRSTLSSPLIEACLLREIGQWHFPPPLKPGELVRHAFYFSSPARTDLLPPEAPQQGPQ